MKSIYLIGSLRNPIVPEVGHKLRELGYDVFDDWHAAGPEADDYWQKYETAKGNTYGQALAGYAAQHVFEFDKTHLDRCDEVMLVMPAGKSGHLEFGYSIGKGKPGYILFDKEPDRYDVMYNFANKVFFSVEEMVEELSLKLINPGNVDVVHNDLIDEMLKWQQTPLVTYPMNPPMYPGTLPSTVEWPFREPFSVSMEYETR